MASSFMQNFGNPRGFWGKIIVRLMNKGHGPLIRRVVEQLDLQTGDEVLDIGCGGGLAVSLMAGRGARVDGVDISPVSVKASRDKNRAWINQGRVAIAQSGVDELDFAPGRFSVVTAFETIYFWENFAHNCKSIFDFLKPGGRFVIALEAYLEDGKKVNIPAIFNSMEMRLYSREELEGLLENAGFSVSAMQPGCKRPSLCLVGQKAA